jgi:hypothetical protein
LIGRIGRTQRSRSPATAIAVPAPEKEHIKPEARRRVAEHERLEDASRVYEELTSGSG